MTPPDFKAMHVKLADAERAWALQDALEYLKAMNELHRLVFEGGFANDVLVGLLRTPVGD